MMEKNRASTQQDLQRETCSTYGLAEVEPEEMVAIAFETLGKYPLHGERVVLGKGEKISWYFYCGGSAEQSRQFKPVHVAHLADVLPEVVRFLRMPPGSGFMIDSAGHEEIWVERDGGIEVMKIERE